MRVCVACELEYSDYLTIGHKDKALVKFLVNNDLIIVVNSNWFVNKLRVGWTLCDTGLRQEVNSQVTSLWNVLSFKTFNF